MASSNLQLIWDLPTRIFHWVFALCVILALVLAQLSHEGSQLFYAHMIFGFTAGFLLLWRLVWGLIGSKHALFSSLFLSPKTLLNYFKSVLSGKGQYHPAHNPGGSLAIWGFFIVTSITVLSGLSMGLWGGTLKEVHEISTNLVLFLVAFHILGVFAATFMNKEPYTLAMIHGYKSRT